MRGPQNARNALQVLLRRLLKQVQSAVPKGKRRLKMKPQGSKSVVTQAKDIVKKNKLGDAMCPQNARTKCRIVPRMNISLKESVCLVHRIVRVMASVR